MKFKLKRIILLLITCIFLFFVFVNLDLREFLLKIKHFDLRYLIPLCLSIVISLGFRAICFKQLISKTVNVSLKELIPLCITGAALNIVLPARAGDIFRAYYVGNKYHTNKIKIFGSVMLERIFDGIIILFLLFIGLYLYNKNELGINLLITSSILFLGSLIICILAFKYNKIDNICDFLYKKTDILPDKIRVMFNKIIKFFNLTCNSFINGFEVFISPKKLIYIMLSSAGIWFFECMNYYITILAFNLDVNWSVILFIISFIALASMIPSTSIFIGPYQIAVISAFSIYHIGKETSLALSIVEQAIVTITTSLIACIFLIKNNISYKELNKKYD